MRPSDTLSSRPCHFMRLPRELRDEIYYLALLSQSPPDFGISPNERPEPSANARIVSRDLYAHPSPFWGRDPMTRLLRVSATFHDEAEGVLYSRFPLAWPEYTNKPLVFRVLKRLRVQARSVIQSVRLHMMLYTTVERCYWRFSDRAKDQWKEVCAWLGWLLPGLRRVEVVMTLKFEEGFPRRSVDRIQPKRAEDMVRLALDILSPFQDSEAEVLRVETAKGSQEGQKGEMIRDMDARIQSGIW